LETILKTRKEPKSVNLSHYQNRIKPQQISSSIASIDELLTKSVSFKEDDTKTNGSSIAFVLEIKGKELLFLADAHPSIIEENLGKYAKENNSLLFFDFIKVAHHGSIHNNTPTLLKLISSSRYLISTNGSSHNHPNKETLALIINNHKDKLKTIYFNYPNDGYESINDTKLKNKYNYETLLTQDYIKISI
jgi:beta-lactamase superfamily II metal-dependent hydrolase